MDTHKHSHTYLSLYVTIKTEEIKAITLRGSVERDMQEVGERREMEKI